MLIRIWRARLMGHRGLTLLKRIRRPVGYDRSAKDRGRISMKAYPEMTVPLRHGARCEASSGIHSRCTPRTRIQGKPRCDWVNLCALR